MTESDIINILREALYEFPVDHIEFNIPDWIGALKTEHPLKQKFIAKMNESITNVDKLRDAENINVNILKDDEISNAYISSLDTDDSLVTITLEAKEELFNLRFQQATGNLEKPSRINELRKLVARMKTVLKERELNEEVK